MRVVENETLQEVGCSHQNECARVGFCFVLLLYYQKLSRHHSNAEKTQSRSLEKAMRTINQTRREDGPAPRTATNKKSALAKSRASNVT